MAFVAMFALMSTINSGLRNSWVGLRQLQYIGALFAVNGRRVIQTIYTLIAISLQHLFLASLFYCLLRRVGSRGRKPIEERTEWRLIYRVASP